ncbi:MAG TPA: hypothetical protein VFE18_19635 [Phenylobacterium sp.]|jgi:hypothetical protein|uniref:hypothetical protein n=1 Tax=Phenylobacterium sp. TaxID=1871053 RepID=UPI002D5D372F|nr:hypothetical protein [Phenylobacterium sp.]HZZ70387.1 hypothetical protein [Phenylobacterium sp.]
MATNLRFINRSQDSGKSSVLLFQKNLSTDLSELPFAWRVIQNCGYDCYHPFVYSYHVEISINDESGNYTPHVTAAAGQLLAFGPGPMGPALAPAGPATSPVEVQLLNAQVRGAMDVNIFRNDLLLARKTSIAPQQKAVFQFLPSLWIGIASQVEQGAALSAAVVSEANTELPLLGVARADIVMTGGGGGVKAQPFAFTLENIVKA